MIETTGKYTATIGLADRVAQPLLLTPDQAAASLSICRTEVYELLRNGDLESVQIGTSRRIPEACLGEYVHRLRCRANDAETEADDRPFSCDPDGH